MEIVLIENPNSILDSINRMVISILEKEGIDYE
jgi:hypothetical protein